MHCGQATCCAGRQTDVGEEPCDEAHCPTGGLSLSSLQKDPQVLTIEILEGISFDTLFGNDLRLNPGGADANLSSTDSQGKLSVYPCWGN